MSPPAQPWPYAFWPARLSLALTGRARLVPPSCNDSAPPLDALRPRFVQAVLLGYVLPIAKAVPLPGFGAAKLGNRPFSERVQGSIPSRDAQKQRGKAQDRGTPSTRSQGSGWSSTTAIQETIQSKASNKKQKERKSSRESFFFRAFAIKAFLLSALAASASRISYSKKRRVRELLQLLGKPNKEKIKLGEQPLDFPYF